MRMRTAPVIVVLSNINVAAGTALAISGAPVPATDVADIVGTAASPTPPLQLLSVLCIGVTIIAPSAVLTLKDVGIAFAPSAIIVGGDNSVLALASGVVTSDLQSVNVSRIDLAAPPSLQLWITVPCTIASPFTLSTSSSALFITGSASLTLLGESLSVAATTLAVSGGLQAEVALIWGMTM